MNLLRVLILFLICVSVAPPARAQVTVVPSKKKVVVDGKSFYLHTVKQGETLYSIGKAYNVLQKDIVFNNPDAFEGIKIGQELKIPVKAEEAPAGSQLESALFIYHITEKGQTAYWLTQHYNISRDELVKYNPELEHSPLQAGQVITIPKKTNGAAQPSKPKTGHAVHTVKRKETLFSIAKSYHVDLNEVLEINPEIDANDPKLKIGQQIKIPLTDAVPINLPVETSKTDTVIIRQDMQIPANDSLQDAGAPAAIDDAPDCAETAQDEFRIAMMLPLFLADNSPASAPDSSMVKDSEGRFQYRDGRYWIHPRSANALEFYEGALLAIDSLKKQGLNAKVFVFDTMRDTVKMAQLLRSPAMKDMDLIIGPFGTDMVNQVRSFAGENRIYYVSPTAINAASLKNNPYLVQVNAGEINAINPVVDYLSKQTDIHVTLIGNNSETDQALFSAYQNKLGTVFADSSFTVHRMRLDSLQQPGHYLKKKRMNVVIIPSADEAFVNAVTGQLHTSSHSFRINLYGLAGWTKFVNLDPEYLHTLEFRYATAFYVDYNKPEVQRFLQQFRKMYDTEPTMLTGYGGISSYAYQFAFLGYDITCYFGTAVRKYGKDFGRCMPAFRLPMLQSDFHFEKVDPFSGYKNTHLDIYKYGKDYTITKENLEITKENLE
ncbi:MAG: LysM peptidoglycan-binding domain-containing protein [Bacteroidales bacterium]|jgi:LysM repeat protein/ABC-type branched-subunit amino acid transport system substrate-binding protein|nr:LysM peptidoglycan-binding domain-containing protein [Bacteroidales bacterium]